MPLILTIHTTDSYGDQIEIDVDTLGVNVTFLDGDEMRFHRSQLDQFIQQLERARGLLADQPLIGDTDAE